MSASNLAAQAAHMRRKQRVRKKIEGTSARPRLSVFRSARHIYAQVIDDVQGVTLASASTVATALQANDSEGKVGEARLVGLAVAAACKEAKVEQVVFDRNGYRYHGRVKAIADGAREGGLQF